MAKNMSTFSHLVPAATTYECNWWLCNMSMFHTSYTLINIQRYTHTPQVTLERAVWIQICLIFSSVSAPSLRGHSCSTLLHTSVLLECISHLSRTYFRIRAWVYLQYKVLLYIQKSVSKYARNAVLRVEKSPPTHHYYIRHHTKTFCHHLSSLHNQYIMVPFLDPPPPPPTCDSSKRSWHTYSIYFGNSLL
jgi:hypothetical protein